MSLLETTGFWLFLTALVAAAVNGALGFGFSSLTVPVALNFLPSRVLNPTLVLLEVPLNLMSLVLNRRALAASWRRVLPILAGVLPGVVLGSLILAGAATLALKAATYAVLLPLVVLQFSGARWPLAYEKWKVGVPAGFGVGVLYSTTTISGPPLAMLLGSQELSQEEFRASMAIIRVLESLSTLVAFLVLGLFHTENLTLSLWLLPAVAIGAPLGRLALRAVKRDSFRRVWVTADTLLVMSGLVLSLNQLGWVRPAVSVSGATSLVAVLVFTRWRRPREANAR